MLLELHPSLEEKLVTVLAKHPESTVKQLLARVPSYTSQALYKELTKLCREGVVFKEGKKFSLNWTWINSLLRFGEETRASYLRSSTALVPAASKRLEHHFSSLLAADDFWAHAVVSLFAHTKAPCMFEWMPHPWFELIHKEKEDLFRATLRSQGRKIYMILGNDTYLDRICSKLWETPVYEYSFAKSPFEALQSEYFDVIGDCILRLKLDKTYAKELQAYYRRTSSKDQVNASELVGLLSRKTNVRIVIERNQLKAKRLQKKFCVFFGIRESRAA